MANFDLKKTQEFYNRIPEIWAADDIWHTYTHDLLKRYIIKHRNIFIDSNVLNAGSGGNEYDINCKMMYHIDIAENKIKHYQNYTVSSIEEIPFEDQFFDSIICVGSVLNYCDAFKAISELARVLKKNGIMILEFESSEGFEYLGTKHYKKPATVITLEYMHEQHTQWLFSQKYVYQILAEYNFRIIDKYPFHILDGILSKVFSESISVKIAKSDKFINKFPFFRKHGNNIIVLCRKI